ncbi:MAG: hypothetical protein U5K31_09105 [Balneolaceae bacterium]|nr:hypothetical protein [Balneolaceae bacterium]
MKSSDVQKAGASASASGSGEKVSQTSASSQASQQKASASTGGAATPSASSGDAQASNVNKASSNGSKQTAEGSGAGQATNGRATIQAAQNSAAASAAPARSSSTPPEQSQGSKSTGDSGKASTGRSNPAHASGQASRPGAGAQSAAATSGSAGNSGRTAGTGRAGIPAGQIPGNAASQPSGGGQPAAFDPSAAGSSKIPGAVSQPPASGGEGKVSGSPGSQNGTGEAADGSGTAGRSSSTSGGNGGGTASVEGRTTGSAPGKAGGTAPSPQQSSTEAPGGKTVAGEGSDSTRQQVPLKGAGESQSARAAAGGTAPRSDTQAAAAYQILNQTEIQARREFTPGMGTTAAPANFSADKMMDLTMNMGGGQDFAEGEGGERGEMSRMEALNTSLLQTNSSSRQKLSVHIARAVRQEMQAGGKPESQWRHHRFLLDDGQSVNISFRQSEGAIQLQLGTGNTELNRLLQQHVEEIRQHLRQELDVDVDLEFQHFGEEGARGDEAAQSHGAESPVPGRGKGPTAEAAGIAGNGTTRGARYLGFNTNEWTA